MKKLPSVLASLLAAAVLHAQTPGIPGSAPGQSQNPLNISNEAPTAAPNVEPAATPAPAVSVPSAAPALPATETPAAAPAGTGTEGGVARAQPVSAQEIVTRLQIFLDQQNFGPGIIDGRWGEFTGKALVHYARAHGLQVTPDIYNQLPLDSVYPIYLEYTITAADVQTVGPTSSHPSEEAKLKRSPYPDLSIFLEERFHASPDFLQKLNPAKKLDDLKAGDIVRVPNVEPFKLEDIKPEQILPKHPEFKNRTIFVSTEDKMLDVYDGKNLIAAYPITPGSKRLPAPLGIWMIEGVVALPEFRWDEEMLEHGHRSENAYEIPPGPRNPVGVLWCGLDKNGIGIHGTSTPETIGRAGSHGCIRLANWDAIRFSKMVTPGMTVTIE